MSGRRRALVTGGSSGIGRGIAETLARDGCDVGIFYLGSADEARPVLDRVRSYGRRGWSFVGDVRDARAVRAAVEAFVAELGGLEVLVNNAGVFRDEVIWKMSDEQWREVIDVDLTGMFHFVRAAVPAMRTSLTHRLETGATASDTGAPQPQTGAADAWGAVVNISSINGLRGKFGQTNYSAAKAGVIGLTKALARETARFNITVNAVAPGLIETPATAAMSADARQRSRDEILLGRMGRVQDVAELVAFLCSDRARFITGEVIRVDGGQYV